MFTIDNAGSAIMAVGALGTAAYGLVDATKAFGGGVSRAGFGHVHDAVAPYISFAGAEAGIFGTQQIVETLRANWMNGMAKADQKAVARSLIRLMLKPDRAAAMARLAAVDPAQLKAAAEHIYANQPLSGADTNALGAFDVAVSATLDLGYERGDQLYRNVAKIVAGAVAIGLTIAATLLVHGAATTIRELVIAVLVGAVATPLAPVAKDLSSALQSAVKAMGAVRR